MHKRMSFQLSNRYTFPSGTPLAILKTFEPTQGSHYWERIGKKLGASYGSDLLDLKNTFLTFKEILAAKTLLKRVVVNRT